MKTKISLTVILSALLLALAPAAHAKEYTIKMVTHTDKGAYAFEPSKLTVASGDKVIWVNAQDDTHNVMSESTPKGVKPFESPMLEKKGQSWSYTFTQSGTYRFHCHPHAGEGMRGEIIVDHPSPTEEQATGHEHKQDDHHAATKSKPLAEQQAIQLLQEGKPVYSCPMHTHIFSDHEEKCPVCGMTLLKVKEIKDGKAVFEEGKGSMNMDMKDMPMKDMNMMEKK